MTDVSYFAAWEDVPPRGCGRSDGRSGWGARRIAEPTVAAAPLQRHRRLGPVTGRRQVRRAAAERTAWVRGRSGLWATWSPSWSGDGSPQQIAG
jgi:hypothetical protein